MTVQIPLFETTASMPSKAAARVEEVVGAGFDVKKFVSNFEVLAESADGVAGLRRLLVDLAVRGNLATQSADEGTGAELAEAIRGKRKVASVKGRTIREPEEDADLAPEPFHIPGTWSWSTMGEVAVKLGAGSTPVGGKSVYKVAGIKFLRSQNVWNDGLRLTDVAHIDRETHARMSGTHIEPGDILLNITGASIGRTSVVPESFDEGNVSQHVAIVRLVDKAIRRFVHLAMTATYFHDSIMDVQVGVSREGLSMKKLQHLRVPLPPLAEQNRIVAKVDQLMALCDDLEARQTDKREIGTRLARSALEALTAAEGPEEFDAAWKRVIENFDVLIHEAEHVSDLRSVVLGLGLRGWLTHRAREGQTNREGLPHGWSRTTLGALAGFVTSGSRAWKNYYAASGATFVRSQDIKTDALDLSSPAFVALPENAEGLRTRIAKDDILITITGANVGKAAHVDREVPEAYVSQHVALVRINDASLAPWLQRWLISPSNGRGHLLGSSYGDKPGLNLTQIRDVVVDLPPPIEREQIMALMTQMLAACDDLEAKLRRAEDRAAKLVEAVVQELVA